VLPVAVAAKVVDCAAGIHEFAVSVLALANTVAAGRCAHCVNTTTDRRTGPGHQRFQLGSMVLPPEFAERAAFRLSCYSAF
jgi:hypothetical protein